MYVSYLGEMNMRALQSFALPQMAALLIVSVGGVEVSMTRGMAIREGRWGDMKIKSTFVSEGRFPRSRTCGYYAMTSAFAVSNGMALVTTIQPGVVGQQLLR